MSARDALGKQFSLHDVTRQVEGYDPEQMGPHNSASFSRENLDLGKLHKLDLDPGTGEQHDESSSIKDGYYKGMESAMRAGNTPPVVATEHPNGDIELHDGWHRASIAVANGMTHLPAFVHRP